LTLFLGLACFLLNVHWARGQADAILTSDLPVVAETQVRDMRGVEVELGSAVVLHRQPVIYPKTAMERRIEGTVVVEVTLDARGEANDARVLSGPAELRRAALESVLNWHFMPSGSVNTRQVSIVFHVPSEAERSSATENADAEPKVSGNQVYFFSRPQTGNGQKEVAEREAQLSELKERILSLQQRQADAKLLEQAERNLADVEMALENARRITESPDGRVLGSIQVLGLPSEAMKELQSRLPVHIGDILTHESIEKIGRAVNVFDEHLDYSLTPLDDGRSVELLIATPGEGEWRVRRE
jgi:TonB family protein